MILTKVISSIIEKGKRILTLPGNGSGDTRTPPEATPYGTDSCPIPNITAVYLMSNVNGKEACVGYVNMQQLAETGEHRIYSTDSDGVLQTYIWLKADGDMLLGGDANFAVKFTELKTEFNKLKTSHNDLVSAFNSHMHLTAGTGSPSAPTPIPGSIPAVANTSNIDNAKNEKIKTV